MTKPRPAIESHRSCKSARELLECLSPGHEDWRDEDGWIFRGQANSEWRLQPLGVRRPGAFVDFGGPKAPQDWSERKEALRTLLARFRNGLNESGMFVPTESPRILLEEFGGTSGGDHPPREAFPLMALAQHHGLPTLLLDWSNRANIAAYFAASYAVDPKSEGLGAEIAVWALSTKEHFDNPRAMLWRKSGHLELYSAPGGTNPNLRAQAGTFTLLWGDDDPDLETYLERGLKHRPTVPRLRLFTLPRREAPDLLKLLSYQGLTAASMFPGIDGVVRAMREESLWRDAGGRLQSVFRLRAECAADLGELLKGIGLERMEVVHTGPGAEVEATLVRSHVAGRALDLETLRGVIADIEDGHVMAETLAPVWEYTSERTYGSSKTGAD